MKNIFLTFGILFCLSGCMIDHGTFTVLSNQISDIDNINLATKHKIKNVKGSSVWHIVILFPFGELNPNIESAMNDAFKTIDGDMFINAKVTESFFYFPYIYGRFAINVEGDTIKTRQ